MSRHYSVVQSKLLAKSKSQPQVTAESSHSNGQSARNGNASGDHDDQHSTSSNHSTTASDVVVNDLQAVLPPYLTGGLRRSLTQVRINSDVCVCQNFASSSYLCSCTTGF